MTGRGSELAAGGCSDARRRRGEVCLSVMVVGLGVWQSIVFFGYKPVPPVDFISIVRTGHEVLSLKMPTNFMRAPVVGMLQAGLSYVAGGPCPDLRAGWLLNALVHPCNLLLFWLVARRLVGSAAIWLTLVVAVNPYVVSMLVNPIVETTLIFFCLLSTYLILQRSRWRYAAVAAATMVRYEAAALVVAAFIVDMIESTDWRTRVRTVVYSAMTCVPLGLWLLGTAVTWRSNNEHYLGMMFAEKSRSAVQAAEGTSGDISKHLESVWRVCILVTLKLPRVLPVGVVKAIWQVSKVVSGVGLLVGVVYGLVRRQRGLLILVLFFVPYVLVHVSWLFLEERHYVSVLWVAVLLCWVGLSGIRDVILKWLGPCRRLDMVLQVGFAVLCVAGVVLMAGDLSVMHQEYPSLFGMAVVAMAVAVAVFAGRIAIYGRSLLTREVCAAAFVCVAIVSSHLTLGDVVGNGQGDMEFKLLARWYTEHAAGEKMVTTMAAVTGLFAPEHAEDLVYMGTIEANGAEAFAKRCREAGVAYVVWDSRLGLRPRHYSYPLLGLENIAALQTAESTADYEFVERIEVNEWQFVNIFRVRAVKADDGV